ncbi:hypothetical protein [Streptomyces sp. TLI_105]|uniref:hypothetical protein n=1 Tax=Streptomyces sp. TLI_105 TaxID=1881019 RepID=UPI00089C9088|nr:hypothetical protein [Streptomyces sp. TLI_105]SEC24896.1 hypothetical protein SAMN05428939_1911 [Streptomyces sp. TLI_105]
MRGEPWDREPTELLRAALSGERGDGSGVAGEEAALAAFREARDTGLHTSLPTRDRDDWTPVAERRRPRRSLKAAVAALVASVTLGGVAVAAGTLPERFLGTTAPPSEPRPTRPTPEPVKPGATAGTSSGAARTSAPPGTTAPLRPEKDPQELSGRSRDALCRAVEQEGEAKGKDKNKAKDKGKTKGENKAKDEGKTMGKASTSAAWQRLVAAAGGEELVPEYCRHDPRPARTPSAGPRSNNGVGRGDSSDNPGKGADRPRADRP